MGSGCWPRPVGRPDRVVTRPGEMPATLPGLGHTGWCCADPRLAPIARGYPVERPGPARRGRLACQSGRSPAGQAPTPGGRPAPAMESRCETHIPRWASRAITPWGGLGVDLRRYRPGLCPVDHASAPDRGRRADLSCRASRRGRWAWAHWVSRLGDGSPLILMLAKPLQG